MANAVMLTAGSGRVKDCDAAMEPGTQTWRPWNPGMKFGAGKLAAETMDLIRSQGTGFRVVW